MAIHSIQIEKYVLAGLIKHPNVYFDIANFVTEESFYSSVHATIFSVIKEVILSSETPNKTLISHKISLLGIEFKDGIDIHEYLDSICFTQINESATVLACKELVKLFVCRQLSDTADKVKDAIKKNKDQPLEKIVSVADSIYNSQIDYLDSSSEPENLFEDMFDIIEERGNNPVEETGLKTHYPKFNELFGGLKPGNIYAIVSRPGQGKALKNSEMIPTLNGWKKIGELKVGDGVFAADGSPTEVVGVAKWKNRPVFKVTFDDGHSVVTDENHEWNCRLRADYKFKNYETKFLFKYLDNGIVKKAPRLCPSSPLQCQEASLPIPPYILGLWLGDGTSTLGNAITNVDPYIINEWEKFGASNGLKLKTRDDVTYFLTKGAGSKKTNPVQQLFKGLNLLSNKHIPSIYLRASEEQRWELLQGLIDSDGYVHERGDVEFCSTNEKLAKDFLELANSLGIKAKMLKSEAKLYDKVCGFRHRVRFMHENAAKIPRKRKNCKPNIRTPDRYITKIEPAGIENTTCIQVAHPSHLFLCGEGMVPTCNSTWINDICFNTCKLSDFKTKALILDTEMDSTDIKLRIASSLTGVPLWFLETGNWRKNEEFTKKVREVAPQVKDYKVWHYQVGNKNIDEVISIVRRWHNKYVGRGNNSIIAYDYIKLTGEKVGNNWAEHQAIGEKINKLKALADEIKAIIITAMQQNRTGENQNRAARDVVDDASAISLSDRLQWFASFVAILRRKTMDELALDGQEFGTHKLIPLKARFQGRNAQGHSDFVERDLGDDRGVRYVPNYLNYNINNFKVEELGSLREIVDRVGEVVDEEQEEDVLIE